MKKILLWLLGITLCLTSYGRISLPYVFSDHMVLQRQVDIPVWGTAPAGTDVWVSLGEEKVHARTDENGKWEIRLPRFKAGGPYELKIFEGDLEEPSIVLTDILIGDVWLASGQSNMEFQVQQSIGADEEIPMAENNNLRFFMVPHKKSLTPQDDVLPSKWEVIDSATVKNLSGVAYYFAKRLETDLNVPIGIIQSTWGGSPVEAWTSREMLLSEPHVRNRVMLNDSITPAHFVKDSLNWITFWDIVYHPKNGMDTLIPEPSFDDRKWNEADVPGDIREWEPEFYEGMIWLRKTIKLKSDFTDKDLTLNLGYPEMNYSLYFNGKEICKTIWNANLTHYYTIPASLVNKGENTIALRMACLWGGGGLNPPGKNIWLTNGQDTMSLTGKWKYHKDLESPMPRIYNYHYYPSYLYNAMIHPLVPYGLKGFIWYQGEANDTAAFVYRKLQPLMINDWRIRWQQGYLPFLFVQLPNFQKAEEEPSDGYWAVMRESQSKTLLLPNTGMACIIDLGEARNIHPKDKIPVGNRLAAVAEKKVYGKNVIDSGPVFKAYRIVGDEIYVSFQEADKGLKTTDKMPPKAFAVAGEDQKFYWASARIEGNEVVLRSDKVKNPVAVRYAWANNPRVNLINSEGLPTVPFRTDSWKVISQK